MTESVTVAILAELKPAELDRVRAAGPRVRVVEAAVEAASYFASQKQDAAAQDAARAALAAKLADTDILFGIRFDRPLLELAPGLRWVQAMSAGVDHLLGIGLEERGVRLTCSRIHSVQISEYVLTMLLALTKRLPDFLRAQSERRRLRIELDEVYEKTLGIVGLGVIGGRIAEIGKFLGMRVVACRRRADVTGGDKRVDRWFPADRLTEMLPECDYVVLAVPGTAGTRQLIGHPELSAMKPSAYLINIARGSVVDEPALVEALTEQRIAGAALDVFAREPLPDDSPLWDLPNVILTPHLAGLTARYNERAVDLFIENLRRFQSGDSLINEVDYAAGY